MDSDTILPAALLPPPLFAARGIARQFLGGRANTRLNLAQAKNEIHALLGKNGAGKGRLVKTSYGAIKPDAGCISRA
jgi:ABC-type uncharacterized transport system ATPase subunit